MTKLSETKIQAQLDEAQKGARTRLLDSGDVEDFVTMVRRARTFARRHGLPTTAIEVEIQGGGVPNGYLYPAETSFLRYANDSVEVCRDTVRKGAYRRCWSRFSRIRIGSVKDHPELRKARSIERFRRGYAYLEG